jgi:hypothetical protein
MATIQVRGRVKNGAIELTETLDAPDGTEVIVTIPEPSPRPVPELPLAMHPAIGMWADREDMADSAEWVAKQRAKWRDRLNRPPDPD